MNALSFPTLWLPSSVFGTLQKLSTTQFPTFPLQKLSKEMLLLLHTATPSPSIGAYNRRLNHHLNGNMKQAKVFGCRYHVHICTRPTFPSPNQLFPHEYLHAKSEKILEPGLLTMYIYVPIWNHGMGKKLNNVNLL